MGTLARYPDWGPHSRNTDPRARVCRFRHEIGVRAVRVMGGSFRSAPADGVFELYEPERPDPVEIQPSGKRLVKVICAWRGGKPNGTGIGASINLSAPGSRAEVIENYTGEVVDNIGYPDDPAPLVDDGASIPAPPISNGPLVSGVAAATYFALPEEVTAAGLVEGAVRSVTVNAYERNPEARRRCVAAHGTTCCICGFNFGTVYGPEAEGYIHVHHVRPLSEVGGEYLVDPVADLRPVCPNCHAVVHLGGRCRTLDEVRQLLQ